MRFLNGGVPGTTPRCWPFFLRAIDPYADRVRAIVIAVDTYADDDSAIGSIDGDNRPMDLRYVVFQTRLRDIPKLAGSFSDPRERIEYGIDLFWRGPELRDDFQALAADPAARIVQLEQAAYIDSLRSARRAPAHRIACRFARHLFKERDRVSGGHLRRRAPGDCDAGADA